MAEQENNHDWPEDGEHLWTGWFQKSSIPPYTQYRTCIHPDCTASEERKAPLA